MPISLGFRHLRLSPHPRVVPDLTQVSAVHVPDVNHPAGTALIDANRLGGRSAFDVLFTLGVGRIPRLISDLPVASAGLSALDALLAPSWPAHRRTYRPRSRSSWLGRSKDGHRKKHRRRWPARSRTRGDRRWPLARRPRRRWRLAA